MVAGDAGTCVTSGASGGKLFGADESARFSVSFPVAVRKAAKASAPATNPNNNNKKGRRMLFLQDRRRSLRDHLRQLRCVPVSQTNAAVGLSVSNIVGFRSAVNPVMFFRKTDPDDANGIVGAGRNFRLRVLFVRVPEKIRVVEKLGFLLDNRNLPIAHGQRIMFTSNCRGVERKDLPGSVKRHHSPVGSIHDHRRSLTRRGCNYIGRADLNAGFLKPLPRVQLGQKLRIDVEIFGDSLKRRFVVQNFQICFLQHVGGDLFEWSGYIFGSDRVLE